MGRGHSLRDAQRPSPGRDRTREGRFAITMASAKASRATSVRDRATWTSCKAKRSVHANALNEGHHTFDPKRRSFSTLHKFLSYRFCQFASAAHSAERRSGAIPAKPCNVRACARHGGQHDRHVESFRALMNIRRADHGLPRSAHSRGSTCNSLSGRRPAIGD